ncbi:MAG: YraN family protein [Pseudomonadota bacterium]
MSGAVSYHAGAAAEEIVATRYQREGYVLRDKRWRGARQHGGGEIDLIFEKGGALTFVEVKKARTFAAAAMRITARQIKRLQAASAGYLATMPHGQLTDIQFDAALVDGQGAVEIVENAFL